MKTAILILVTSLKPLKYVPLASEHSPISPCVYNMCTFPDYWNRYITLKSVFVIEPVELSFKLNGNTHLTSDFS